MCHKSLRNNFILLLPFVQDAPDYYEIIQCPMCLSQMMSKIDREEYKTKQSFLDDVKLIVTNALEYNPDRNMEGNGIKSIVIINRELAIIFHSISVNTPFLLKVFPLRDTFPVHIKGRDSFIIHQGLSFLCSTFPALVK